jgi:hypothetical protein
MCIIRCFNQSRNTNKYLVVPYCHFEETNKNNYVTRNLNCDLVNDYSRTQSVVVVTIVTSYVPKSFILSRNL